MMPPDMMPPLAARHMPPRRRYFGADDARLPIAAYASHYCRRRLSHMPLLLMMLMLLSCARRYRFIPR